MPSPHAEDTEEGAALKTVIQFGDDLVLAVCEAKDRVADERLSENGILTPDGIEDFLHSSRFLMSWNSTTGVVSGNSVPLLLVFDECGAQGIVCLGQLLDHIDPLSRTVVLTEETAVQDKLIIEYLENLDPCLSGSRLFFRRNGDDLGGLCDTGLVKEVWCQVRLGQRLNSRLEVLAVHFARRK